MLRRMLGDVACIIVLGILLGKFFDIFDVYKSIENIKRGRWMGGRMYSALDVAKYVIQYCGERHYFLSNLKLQKILYFIQAEFLIVKGYPCFYEDIEAWAFGPVVPDVYHEYKIFGSAGIVTSDSVDYAKEIQDQDLNLINGIVDDTAEYSTSALVDITLHQKPWEVAYSKYRNNKISNQSIKNFFETEEQE